jgi:PTS system galactitol-specific IIA component
MKIDEAIIALDVEVNSSEALISILAEKLLEAGYVDETYGQATIVRERIHPTGLPTKPFPIAIPHADAEGVITSALAFASMKQPVMFCNMVEPEEELPAEMVFMIANNTPEEQVKVLRKLATLFGDPEKLVELKALTQSKNIVDWFEVELSRES